MALGQAVLYVQKREHQASQMHKRAVLCEQDALQARESGEIAECFTRQTELQYRLGCKLSIG
jgi:hypothetical protein